ncbi:MAG: T6SS immunity protein Tli4 family protein [Telluria sp.]|nr:T6SS immunity protein Tli4 family protein [Telluria sp.]
MKALSIRAFARMLTALVALGLSGAFGMNATEYIRYKYEVRKMTQEMKTMCVGRFLIDVPADAEMSFRPAFLSGWDIWTNSNETDEQFERRLEKKEAELKKAKNEKGWDSLESATPVRLEGVRGKILIHSRVWFNDIEDGKRTVSDFVSVHAFVRIGGISFNFTGKAPFQRDDAKELKQFIAQIKPRAADEIPREPGFCIERGFIQDPLAAAQHERITMFVGLKGHPDVSIFLDTAAGLKPGESLLVRKAGSDLRKRYPSQFHNIRWGTRVLAGIQGDEAVTRVSELNGIIRHSFQWETVGTQDNVFEPTLALELGTGYGRPGKPVNASLSDEALLVLWDKMTSSLRLRPTNIPKPAVAAATIPPLGSYAAANNACPVSGWWQCTDGSHQAEVDGGEYRYFRQGERMPQAVMLAPPTLWQRITGARTRFSHNADTQWKLTDHRKVPRPGHAAPQQGPLEPTQGLGAGQAPTAVPSDDDDILKTPVGTLVATGNACPQSGWWFCPKTDSLSGAQWFRQGALLPMASISVSRTWWERLRGKPGVYQSSTSWKLIRYDETPLSKAALSNTADGPDEHAAPDGASNLVGAAASPAEAANAFAKSSKPSLDNPEQEA